VPLTAVSLDDDFWAPRLHLNREVTLPLQYRYLEETGRLDNFRRAAGQATGDFQGYYFNDSDVYKWLEAAAWTLATTPDPALTQMVDAAIRVIADAQQPDGYLNSYFIGERAHERWTNLKDKHELYCAGHLFQAAVAHHRATGSEQLLNIARRFADLIVATFGPEAAGKRPGTCGHPEVEMALIELARETGEARYREQAQYFIDVRGRGLIGGRPYHQDHQPFREMERMTGHAVRAAYLNSGAADLYAETGDPALHQALDRLWQNMTTRQMYISGGIGSRHEGEAFGNDYELPNERAYAETCAAIASIFWAWRMLQLDGDARYADVMELTLYNGFLAGLSLDGRACFYENPLADDGSHRRQEWFECACCPPNIARLLASLPGYFYSVADAGIWVHLYATGKAHLTLPDGRTVDLSQQTLYPWHGAINLQVDGSGEFSLWLRLPAWCESGATLEINQQPFTGTLTPGTYLPIHRTWQPGDQVRLHLPLPVRRVECHPYVQENRGRVALMRGPILYCVEQVDLPGADLRDLVLPADGGIATRFRPALLGGVMTLTGPAMVVPPDTGWSDHLYRTAPPQPPAVSGRPVLLTAIPYYAWANRDPGPMQVWLTSQ